MRKQTCAQGMEGKSFANVETGCITSLHVWTSDTTVVASHTAEDDCAIRPQNEDSVVDKKVEENKQYPGMYAFRAEVDTEDSEQESFKKRLCNEIFSLVTGTPWDDMVKVEKRDLWKEVRSTGDQTLLQSHMEQVTEDLLEQAAFNDRKRFEIAVSSTIARIGWESHPSIIQGAAAMRAIYTGGEDSPRTSK